jgi:hypothetical protein
MNKNLADWQAEAKFQCSFEKAIKKMQHKEPPRDLSRANIQTFVGTNLIGNFGSNTKNQATESVETNDAIGVTETINVTIDIITIRTFSILEEINQLFLEGKHTFTLGQLFKIALNLKQYIDVKLAPRTKKYYHNRTQSSYFFNDHQFLHGCDISPSGQKHC